MAVFFRNSVFLIGQLILSIIIIPILMSICVVTLNRILIGIINQGNNLCLIFRDCLWIVYKEGRLIIKKILFKMLKMIMKRVNKTKIIKIMKILFLKNHNHKSNDLQQILTDFFFKRIKKVLNLKIFITKNLIIIL